MPVEILQYFNKLDYGEFAYLEVDLADLNGHCLLLEVIVYFNTVSLDEIYLLDSSYSVEDFFILGFRLNLALLRKNT